VQVGRPGNLFSKFHKLFQFTSISPNYKIETRYFHSSKLCKVENKFKRNNFQLAKKFKFQIDFEFKIQEAKHRERAKNTKGDELAKAAARRAVLPLDVFFQLIEVPFVKTIEPEPRMVNDVQGEDWRAHIMAYLRHHYEPDNSTELTRMQQRAKAYQIINDELYKASVTGPLLRYLSNDDGRDLLTQTHSGVCRGHIGARALAAKVFRQGFYWPAAEMGHQHSRTIDNSTRKLQICSSGGGIFHKMDRGEASSQRSSTGAEKIFLENIICRFGRPKGIIVDNAKIFDYYILKDFFH
jgi:hypothetical protein